jgi:RNA polymerase sigma-70 factor (ECF subfamily)
MDEVCLAERLVSGNMYYFEELVNLYHKRIYDFSYRMVHNRSTAEDITQDVFIKVYKNIHKLNSARALKPWILKIAYTTSISYLRKNKYLTIDIESNEIASNEDCIGEYESRETILKEIEALSTDCRAIFLLRIMEDLSFEQIALMTETSVSSVKSKFYRSRKILIDRLSKSFREV